MRILFLCHYFPPEVNAPASRTFEHCREWVRAGHEATVLTNVPNHPAGKIYPGYRNALAQIAVSGFTGLIGGLISVESGLSLYMILVTSGISGAMGSVALTYFWERLTGMKNANQ